MRPTNLRERYAEKHTRMLDHKTTLFQIFVC
jgi:hypothetical protein